MGENISTRLLRFAARVLRLWRKFPAEAAAKHLVRQLVRAATAGGANYAEACGSASRADFVHKIGIANKEVRESMYWLELAREAELSSDCDRELEALVSEANELIAILTASIKTAKSRDADGARPVGTA